MNPSRPTMSREEAKQFTKDFSQLNARLIGKLTLAKTMEEAKEALSMLENLANFDLPQAKTLYGMMFLMNGKPWYDITKALYWLKKGAEEADGLKEHFAAESMYQYGMILLDGLHGVPRDPITGKYWIDKAAGMRFFAALEENEKKYKDVSAGSGSVDDLYRENLQLKEEIEMLKEERDGWKRLAEKVIGEGDIKEEWN